MELLDTDLEPVCAGKDVARRASATWDRVDEAIGSISRAADSHSRAADSLGKMLAPPGGNAS